MSFIERITAKFHVDALAERIASLLPDVLSALITVLSYWLVWRGARWALRKIGARQHINPTTLAFVLNGLKALLTTLGLVTAPGQLGVDTASLFASLGIIGLTIGFAARDALSNIISGILIFRARPFVLGDLIEVSGFYGRVDRITLRSTRVVTPDGRMIAIPNTTIVSTPVSFYTNFPTIRVDVLFTVGTGSDLAKVREILCAVAAADPDFMSDPAPSVSLNRVGDYFVEVGLYAWLSDEKTHIDKRLELRERAFEALRAAGIDMPYETLALAPLSVSTKAA
jgi:small conductance mechanosensitive channel